LNITRRKVLPQIALNDMGGYFDIAHLLMNEITCIDFYVFLFFFIHFSSNDKDTNKETQSCQTCVMKFLNTLLPTMIGQRFVL